MTHIIDEYAYNQAIKRNILMNAQKTFFKNENNRLALGYVQDNAHKGGFFESLNKAFDDYGKLTENQVNAVLKIISNNEAKKLEWAEKNRVEGLKSNFVGEIKQRLILTLTCLNIVELHGQAFGYYDDGVSFMQIFKDENDNVFKYTGKNVLIEKGETAVIKATIKNHAVYQDTKQTVINRPIVQ